MSTTRRRLLQTSANAAAAALLARRTVAQDAAEEAVGLGAEDAAAPTTTGIKDEKFVRFLLREADDSPLDAERMRLLYARDLANDPLPQTVVDAEGRARIALSKDEPIQAVCRLNVPDFGEVYCYADNGGKGFTKVENVEFVVDAAATRLRRVRETLEQTKPLGVPSDPEFDRHLEAAVKPLPKESGKARTAAAYESLSHGLHAGERLALNLARHRISRLSAPRKEFGFGAMISGFDNEGPKFVEAFKRAFNQATTGWYWWGPADEPPEQRINYQRMDATTQWCLDNGIKPKGFGYCYMSRGATPEWMRPVETPTDAPGDAEGSKRAFNPRWPFERIKEEYVRVVRQTAARYHGRVKLMEIINEAHDKANLWHLNHAPVLELTKAVLDAARAGSSDVQRMMNHCCMWGEYAKKPNVHGERAWSPLQ